MWFEVTIEDGDAPCAVGLDSDLGWESGLICCIGLRGGGVVLVAVG